MRRLRLVLKQRRPRTRPRNPRAGKNACRCSSDLLRGASGSLGKITAVAVGRGEDRPGGGTGFQDAGESSTGRAGRGGRYQEERSLGPSGNHLIEPVSARSQDPPCDRSLALSSDEMLEEILRQENPQGEAVEVVEPDDAQDVGGVDRNHQREGEQHQRVERPDLPPRQPPDVPGVVRRGEGVHADGDPEPEKEVRDRIGAAEHADRHEGGETEDDAQDRVDDQRPDRHQEGGGEVLRLLVDHVARGVADPEEADVEDREAAQAAEQHVRRLVDDHSRKGRDRDEEPGDEEHAYPPPCLPRPFGKRRSYSLREMISRVSRRWRIRSMVSSNTFPSDPSIFRAVSIFPSASSFDPPSPVAAYLQAYAEATPSAHIASSGWRFASAISTSRNRS